MADFVSFGRPDRFEIAIRERRQRDRSERQPHGYGWSLGDLRITVGGRVLTANVLDGRPRDFTTWYLLPVFEWLAHNWVELLHEEDFGWREDSPAVAATIVPRVLAETTGKDDGAGIARYEAAQGWRDRHGLRAAANGGLLPDLYLRRFLDGIELSWTDAPTLFSPDGFRFVPGAGYASCSVDDVATPLWDALDEFVGGVAGRPALADDRARLAALADRLAELRHLTVIDLARARIRPAVLSAAIGVLGRRTELLFRGDMVANDIPAVSAFSPAIAMYGGMSPQLGIDDVRRLSEVAVRATERGETPALREMVRDQGGMPRRQPYLEGYALADDLLDTLLPGEIGDFVDIRRLIDRLEIEVVELALDTDTIRGVGLAGSGTGPTIVVNMSSSFNATAEGRRFTLAHELCHILYDRGQARRVGITSGPWAPAAVERRANAFAAVLMMPRHLVVAAFAGNAYIDVAAITAAAERLRVGRMALVEHLYNMHLIDDALTPREVLRRAVSH